MTGSLFAEAKAFVRAADSATKPTSHGATACSLLALNQVSAVGPRHAR
jgi:hypothetical protein